MKPHRFATKISQNEDTQQIHANPCVFLWGDVVGMEGDKCSEFEYPEPRVWIWLDYASFYIVGKFEEVAAEWEAYLEQPDNSLAFTRN